jgi:hypothetical protein
LIIHRQNTKETITTDPKWFTNSRIGGGVVGKKKDAFDSLENRVHADSFEGNHSRSAIGDEKQNKPKYR